MLKPLGDRIVVERDDPEEMTASGLYLPLLAQQRPWRGRVIAVGPGRWRKNGRRHAPDCSVGDTVYFEPFPAPEVEVDGRECLLIREGDLHATNERRGK